MEKNEKRNLPVICAFAFALVLIAVVFVVMFVNRKDELQGRWAVDEVTIYEFDGKGSGRLDLPTADYEFAYTVDDSRVSIDFKNTAASDRTFTFELSGETLTLIEDNGTEYILKKESK